MLHLLVPTTDLLNEYHDVAVVRHRRSRPVREVSTAVLGNLGDRRPHARSRAVSLSGGPAEGRRQERRPDYCEELGLPELPPEFVPPFIVGDVGSNPAQYGNQGILLNSEGLKNWLFGPLDGPPRNTAQIGMPG